MNFVPLGGIADIQLGKMLSPKAKNGPDPSFPYLRNQNVQWGRIEFSDLASMQFSAKEREKFLLRDGDLLVCEGGEPGRCAVWRGEHPECYYQKALHRVRPHAEIADSEFLSLWIRHQALAGSFDDQNAKTTIAHLPLVRLQQLPVPDVSVAAQRRIAARLKTQFAAVETARKAARAQATELKALVDRLQETEFQKLACAPRVQLGEILRGIETGKSFQTTDRIAKANELGVLKVSAVSWSEFKPEEAKAVARTYVPDPHHHVRAGDLLMSRANTLELVGAVVHVPTAFPNRLLSDKTLRLVLDENRACAGYVMRVLRMQEARAHIETNATGTSSSMRNISQDTIRATPIPLPGLREQCEVAERMWSIERSIAKAQSAATAQLADLESLPARLLAQAFDCIDKEASP